VSAARRVRTAILVSGSGSNMMALIAAAGDPAFPADIVLVVSNRPAAPALRKAVDAGIPARCIDHRAHLTGDGLADRESFEQALTACLLAEQVELVALAGFMRVLTPDFVTRWPGRLINIHPSLLPAFRGLHTHERALAEGVKLHGCSVHHVVPELDAGPLIAQAAVPVLAQDDAASLAARVLRAEHRLFPAALAAVAQAIRAPGQASCWLTDAKADAVLSHPVATHGDDGSAQIMP
jgi:phosphoribosylglycinamide formyltransferase 1